MTSGNGYREFVAAFGRGEVKAGDVIVAGDANKSRSVRGPEMYEVVDGNTLLEYILGSRSNFPRPSRKKLQGMPWYVSEKAAEQER
ncbi:MAG: hypothetical protein HYT72_04085 [Candidatus Aenigmarchaeota archaeon]|nr:hypothetical protein [Candidatus Aenigmarchaeota archaeon]